MDLSVITVSFNAKERLRECLRAVFLPHSKVSFEMFGVDNASMDGSGEMVAAEFPNVKLIRNQENVGYSRANNQSIKQILCSLKTKYILLLNPDVIVESETFDKVVAFMDNNSDTGICGCK